MERRSALSRAAALGAAPMGYQLGDTGSVVDLEAEGRTAGGGDLESSCGILEAACGPRVGHAAALCMGSLDAQATGLAWHSAGAQSSASASPQGRLARTALLASFLFFFWWAASTAPLWASTRRPALNPRIPG